MIIGKSSNKKKSIFNADLNLNTNSPAAVTEL